MVGNRAICPMCGAQANNPMQTYCLNCGAALSDKNDAFGAAAPVAQLNSSRALWKMIIFSIITFGIYPLVFYSGISNDINIIAGRYDGRRTMHWLLLFFIVGPITLGIAYIVWFHNISDRIGRELMRRQINYAFGAGDFWLWNVLGSLIIVGPFIYVHKLAEASNYIASHYNRYG